MFGLKQVLAKTSGVDPAVLDTINTVAKTGDPEMQNAFKAFMKKNANLEEIPNTTLKAIDQLGDNESAAYLQTHSELSTAYIKPNILSNSFVKVLNDLGPKPHIINRDELVALNNMYKKFRQFDPQTATDYDALRKSLRKDIDDFARSVGPDQAYQFRGKFNTLLDGIKDSIGTVDKTYADMLDRWANWRKELSQYQGQFGLKKNVGTASSLNKLLKSLKDPQKRSLLDKLATTEAGKNLPAMIAGAAVSEWLPDWSHTIQDALLYGLGASQLGFGVPHALGAFAAASPRTIGSIAYGAGRLGRRAGALSTLFPAATNISSTIGQNMGPDLSQTASGSYFKGGRIGRKSGGRIGDAGSAAEKLIAAAEKAKNRHSDTTSPLLDAPDEAITKALAIANENI